MSFGFNTDVRTGARTLHVQTEARGQNERVIETAVYQDGMILYSRAENCGCFGEQAAFSQRVEEQHRAMIEELRSGALDPEIAAALERARRAAGISVQLLNPKSWLSEGNVSLDIEILSRADRQPEAGAQVEATIEGATPDARHTGISDDRGRVRIEFRLPPLQKGGRALVILARTDCGTDELRFTMRARPKTQPIGSPR